MRMSCLFIVFFINQDLKEGVMEQLVKNKIEFSDYDALLGKLWKQSEGRNIDFNP
jgi:hypothetical protein